MSNTTKNFRGTTFFRRKIPSPVGLGIFLVRDLSDSPGRKLYTSMISAVWPFRAGGFFREPWLRSGGYVLG